MLEVVSRLVRGQRGRVLVWMVCLDVRRAESWKVRSCWRRSLKDDGLNDMVRLVASEMEDIRKS